MTALAEHLARDIERAAASSPGSLLARLCKDPERRVGANEASAITGYSLATLATYRCRGILRAVSRPGHRVRYRVGDLLSYIEAGSLEEIIAKERKRRKGRAK
jgi:hypothetical protein